MLCKNAYNAHIWKDKVIPNFTIKVPYFTTFHLIFLFTKNIHEAQ